MLLLSGLSNPDPNQMEVDFDMYGEAALAYDIAAPKYRGRGNWEAELADERCKTLKFSCRICVHETRIELMGGACCSRHVTAVSPSQDFEPRQHFASAPRIYVASGASEPRRLYVEDSNIAVRHNRLEEVLEALAHAGLESSNLIVGIDFTKSNEWTGTESFYRRSLHHLGDEKNPYEQAMSIIGKALASFNENNLIRCFGFGDATTRYQEVFSFYPDEKLCNGYEEVLGRYRELVPYVQLAGPTSFAPVIEMAITVIEKSGGQYHVLLIIADGKADTLHEGGTIAAIVKASEYPLSIILVGVGDGPWDSMREFIDSIPVRGFDNFQFVNFTQIMSKNMNQPEKEAEFSLAGLIKLPSQYKQIKELNLLGVSRGMAIHRVPLPPPTHTTASFGTQEYLLWSNLILSAPSSNLDHTAVCYICRDNPVDMVFGCGHQTCRVCGVRLESCPFCRCSIETRFVLS